MEGNQQSRKTTTTKTKGLKLSDINSKQKQTIAKTKKMINYMQDDNGIEVVFLPGWKEFTPLLDKASQIEKKLQSCEVTSQL